MLICQQKFNQVKNKYCFPNFNLINEMIIHWFIEIFSNVKTELIFIRI